MYDIARVEVLAGPQGTLYGASSQAGTIRIITNKPDPDAFDAGFDVTGNTISKATSAISAEGFVNIPLGDKAAIRLVGWAKHEPGYIDNVLSTRVLPDLRHRGRQQRLRRRQLQRLAETYGARVALGIDLNDTWTLTPTRHGAEARRRMASSLTTALVGDLEVAHCMPERHRRQVGAGRAHLEGKIGNWDLTYAGAYLKRDDDTRIRLLGLLFLLRHLLRATAV